MFRRTAPILALALSLAATPAGAAAAKAKQKRDSVDFALDPKAGFGSKDTTELLRQAKDFWLVQQDFTAALAKFNEAVASAPDDNDVRLQRAHYFEVLSQIVISRDQAKFKEAARADFDRIIASDPESLIAGVARDGLTRLTGEALLEPKVVTCPALAATVHTQANMLYGARRYAEAAVEYERAATACPENAGWWVDLADTCYELDDYQRAKATFVKALSLDPWHREAHRFLSDTYAQLGDYEATLHELTLAVISDPTYEAGWSALRAYGSALGRSWSRVYGDRKAVAGNPDAAAWAAYEAARADARQKLGESASALAVEREAVEAALKSTSRGPFWSMLARAERGGYLDEAIFLHLLDSSLAPEYRVYREKNAERLATYLGTLLR